MIGSQAKRATSSSGCVIKNKRGHLPGPPDRIPDRIHANQLFQRGQSDKKAILQRVRVHEKD